MILGSALVKSCRHFRRRLAADGKKGSAAIEFAMIAPVLFLFLFGIIETGVIFFANTMLQNATDDTARMIRTGQLTGALTSTALATQVCSEVTGLISATDCQNNLLIDLRADSAFTGASYPSVTKGDGTIDTTKITVQATAGCDVVLLRTFYPWSIMTPLMRPLLQNTQTGLFLLSAAAAFRTEPYAAGQSC